MRNIPDESSFAQCLDRSLKGRLHLPLAKSILTKVGEQPGRALTKPAKEMEEVPSHLPDCEEGAAMMLVTTECQIAQVLRRLSSTRGK
jgi:hypothetical protein